MIVSVRVLMLTVLMISLSSCFSQVRHTKSSVMDYLYPTEEATKIEPSVPHLKLPLKVGIAFVPQSGVARGYSSFRRVGADALTEKKRIELLEQVASHFRELTFVKDIEVIPSAYLKPSGGFANLDQVKTMYDIDVIALVSYDQTQFTDSSAASLSYWTIVGAYVISGEKNDTSTMMDTVVYDISSRKMLFRAPGLSQIKGSATPISVDEELRVNSEQGFDEAARQMIENLDLQLERFQEKVKQRPEEFKVSQSANYSGGGGGALDWALLSLLMSVAVVSKIRHIKA